MSTIKVDDSDYQYRDHSCPQEDASRKLSHEAHDHKYVTVYGVTNRPIDQHGHCVNGDDRYDYRPSDQVQYYVAKVPLAYSDKDGHWDRMEKEAEITVVSKEEFDRAVHQQAGAGEKSPKLGIYTHGVLQDMDTIVTKAAEISADANETIVIEDWDTGQTRKVAKDSQLTEADVSTGLTLRAYGMHTYGNCDGNQTAESADPMIRESINHLSDEFGDQNIDLIAQSHGNTFLMDYLTGTNHHFRSITLAHPDVPENRFLCEMGNVLRATDHFNLLYDPDDQALAKLDWLPLRLLGNHPLGRADRSTIDLIGRNERVYHRKPHYSPGLSPVNNYTPYFKAYQDVDRTGRSGDSQRHDLDSQRTAELLLNQTSLPSQNPKMRVYRPGVRNIMSKSDALYREAQALEQILSTTGRNEDISGSSEFAQRLINDHAKLPPDQFLELCKDLQLYIASENGMRAVERYLHHTTNQLLPSCDIISGPNGAVSELVFVAPAMRSKPQHEIGRMDSKGHWKSPDYTRDSTSGVIADVPLVSPCEFASSAKQIFKRINTAGDGYITKAQLTAAMDDPYFSEREQQVIAALYKHMFLLENMVTLEEAAHSKSLIYIGHPSSITMGDLDKLEQMQKRVEEVNRLEYWAKSRLASLCSHGVGKSQLDQLLQQPGLDPLDRDGIELLKRHYDDLSKISLNFMCSTSLTLASIHELALRSVKSPEAQLLNGLYSVCRDVHDVQAEGCCRDLYSDKDPINSIKPDAVKQGYIGDCYFEAALASLASANPKLIKDCIRDNHNGTYTVTFPGAPNEPITVMAPTAAEQAFYNQATTYGIWPSVMEKAFGAWCQQDWTRRNIFNNLGGGYMPEEGCDGGAADSRQTISVLTGNPAFSRSVTIETALPVLTKAFEQHPPKVVTASINHSFFSSQTSEHFPRQHVYSILDFTPDGNGGGTVTVRNPWGGKDDTTSGTIKISLQEFTDNFDELWVEGGTETVNRVVA